MGAAPQRGDECELSFAEAVTLAERGVRERGPQLLQPLRDGLRSRCAACWLCCCYPLDIHVCTFMLHTWRNSYGISSRPVQAEQKRIKIIGSSLLDAAAEGIESKPPFCLCT